MSSKAIKSGLKKCKELLSSKNYDGVIKETDGIIQVEPNNYSARIFRGKALSEKGDLKRAESDFRVCVDTEPDKPLGYQGLLAVYEQLKWHELYLGITRSLSRSDSDRKPKVITDALDVCRFNEFYAEWCELVVQVEPEEEREKTIEAQYGNIPFSALKEGGLIDQIKLDSTVKKTVFAIWAGKVNENTLQSEFNQALYKLETDGTITNEEKSLPSQVLGLLKARENGAPARECIVTARQLLQKFEKFDFILGKKNLKADDIEQDFQYCFDSDQDKSTIRLFILEEILYRAEVPDLELAEEMVKEVQSGNLFNAKLALLKANYAEVRELLSSPTSSPSLPPLLRVAYADFESVFAQRLLYLQAELSLCEEDSSAASDFLAQLDESAAETLYLRGRLNLLTGDFKSSIKCFLKAAKQSSSNWAYFFWLGRAYVALGDTERGVKCVIKSVQLNQRADNIEFACQYVEPERALALLKSFRETQEVIGVNQETQLPRWYQFRLGLALLELGTTNQAIKVFQRLTRSKDDPVVWECLAEAYVQRGSLRTALKSYQKTAELYTSNPTKMAQVHFRIGQLYLDTMEVDNALEVFESVELKSSPLLLGMARARLEKAREFAAAWLPQLAYREVEIALSLCFESFSLGTSPDSALVWKLVGDCLLLSRLFNVPGLRLTVPESLSVKGESQLTREECLRGAITAYCRVIKSTPSPCAWSDLSIAYFCVGESSRAITCAKKSVECVGSLSKQLKSELWYNLGVVAFSSSPSLAQHALVVSLECNSENSRSWTLLGLLYMKVGEARRAYQALVRAQAADTENAEAWAGLAHLAEAQGDQEVTDLFRHAAELGNRTAARGHAFHVAANLNLGKDSDWVKRNVEETNGLVTAQSNLTKLANVDQLGNVESLVAGFLADRLGLSQTVLSLWSPLTPTKELTLSLARTKAKLGLVDEALELIAPFEKDDDLEVVSTVGFVLSKADCHQMAFEHYLPHCEKPEIGYLAGISALRSGEVEQACELLTQVAERVVHKDIHVKAIRALGAIGWLTRDEDLLEGGLKLLRSREPELRLELEVRLLLVKGLIREAVAKCSREIHARPDRLDARLLLARILLRHDPANGALASLLPPNPSYGALFAQTQLAGRGKEKQKKCARLIAAQYHAAPWDKQLKAAYVASLDQLSSSEGMNVKKRMISYLPKVQTAYLTEMAEEQECSDADKVWLIATLTRLGGGAVDQCLALLEEVDEEYHCVLLATLTTLAEPVSLGESELTVETVLDLLEAKGVPVPAWLPSLLGTIAVRSNQPELALRCYLLLVNGIGDTRQQSLRVLQEVIKLIELSRKEGHDIEQWVTLGHDVAKQLLDSDPKSHIALMLQGILFGYGGDVKRATRQLLRLLNKEGCSGLWRSCARFYLSKLLKDDPKKLEAHFEKSDPLDPLFAHTKSIALS